MRLAATLALVLSAVVHAGPPKTVVLTFDDAVKSHRTVVAPLLKELGFGATFFVSHAWMTDPENFLTWQEVAELHQMGFEIGNHSWTHPGFSTPRVAARLPAELALVENELARVGVPKPVSFAFSGNGFGPEAVRALAAAGYRFGRRGMQPEVEYGKVEPGPLYEPGKHHPLLIPTSGDGYPGWTLEHFRRVVDRAGPGRIVVLQFHGVPDPKHPWVHTPPERFREYMRYLKEGGFEVIAMRDLARFPMASGPAPEIRYPDSKGKPLPLPVEMEATRANLDYWRRVMAEHRYSPEEAALVTGIPETLPPAAGHGLRLLPYPGGRHPRIGFLEGAICPQRGTKASVFLPWSDSDYLVVDLPEAIFSNLGLIYLAHTHIPTYWDDRNVVIDNVDWVREADGSLRLERTLPNRIAFGSSIRLTRGGVEMDLWLRNGTAAVLTGLRTQVCVMLKGAPEFNAQTNDNKEFGKSSAVVRSASGRVIQVEWERCGRTWGNPRVPCLHADPVLPDCAPGQTVKVKGKLSFPPQARSIATTS